MRRPLLPEDVTPIVLYKDDDSDDTAVVDMPIPREAIPSSAPTREVELSPEFIEMLVHGGEGTSRERRRTRLIQVSLALGFALSTIIGMGIAALLR